MKQSAFLGGLKRMTSATKSAGRAMGNALEQPISDGLDSAKSSFNDLMGSVKSGVTTALGLGGALSLGVAVDSARDAQKEYLQLSSALSTFEKRSVKAAEAQAIVQRVADKTKIPLAEVRQNLFQLASAAEKADIEPLLERAGSQARRLGMEGEFISRVYTRLVAKGVATTADEAEGLTEQFNQLFRSMLGVDLDEAIDPNDVAELAGFMNSTGNTAGEMLKIISLGGKEIVKDFGKANEIVEELGLSLHQTKGIDEMTEKLKLKKGVISANQTALENMLAIADLGPKKFGAMADALAGDIAGQALKEIVGEELIVKAKTGKVTTKEWELRVGELRNELMGAKDIMVDRAKIEAEDAAHKETLAAKFDDAMNKLQKSFESPEMVDAIEELAKHLPALAEALGDLVKFVAENPLTALAGAGALKVGGGFLSGFSVTLFKKWGSVLKKDIIGAGRGFGKQVDTSGHSFLEAANKGGSAHLSAVTKATAVLGAAVAGWQIGSMIHEQITGPQAEKAAAKLDEAGEAAFKGRAAARSGNVERMQAAIDELQRASERLPESVLSVEGAIGQMTSVVTGVKSPLEQIQDRRKQMDDAIVMLTGAIQKQAEQQTKSGDTLRTFRENVDKANRSLGETPRNATRGTAPLPIKPGHEAVGASS